MIPAILGGLGLISSISAQKKQNSLLEKGVKSSEAVSREQLAAMRELSGIAKNYNPDAELAASVDLAQRTSQRSLTNALKNVRGDAGSYAGADSEFHVQGQRRTDDVMNSLSSFIASAKANSAIKKAALYQGILGAPVGQIAQGYFNAAQNVPGANPNASMQMLSQGLTSIFQKSNDK